MLGPRTIVCNSLQLARLRPIRADRLRSPNAPQNGVKEQPPHATASRETAFEFHVRVTKALMLGSNEITPHRNLASASLLCYNFPMSTTSSNDFRAKYGALEDAVYAARAKRAANKRLRDDERRRAFGDLCEASEGRAKIWRRDDVPLSELVALADGDVWLLQTLARWVRLTATQRISRLRHAVNRPAYYERERARRQALAAVRRSTARRTTENPRPTKEQVLEAFLKAKNSNEDMICFGSLLEDLACYVDSTLLRDSTGAIVGRRGGIKAWLQTNLPVLYLKYSTVMRYKAAAKKLKQLCELPDPVPAERIVAPAPRADEPPVVLRSRAIYLEVAAGATKSRTAFLDRLDAFLDPERVEEATTLKAWRERYAREITVRSRRKWRSRLWKSQSA